MRDNAKIIYLISLALECDQLNPLLACESAKEIWDNVGCGGLYPTRKSGCREKRVIQRNDRASTNEKAEAEENRDEDNKQSDEVTADNEGRVL